MSRAGREGQAGGAPTWRGRLLPRPMLRRSRTKAWVRRRDRAHRRASCAGSVWRVGLGLVACRSAPEAARPSRRPRTSGEIPDETAGRSRVTARTGPDVLEESGVIRSDIRRASATSTGTAEGVPMTLELTSRPRRRGLRVRRGGGLRVALRPRRRYSLYSEGAEDQNYLRGAQVADHDGIVRFASIFPACYAGRWPHIHFEVYPDRASITDSANAIATSQVALPKATCDEVYATTGYEQSAQILGAGQPHDRRCLRGRRRSAPARHRDRERRRRLTVKLAVRVDTSTTPSAGGFGA